MKKKPTLHAERTLLTWDEWAGMGRLLGINATPANIRNPEVWNRMMIQLGMEPTAKKGEVISSDTYNEMVRRLYHS